MTLSKNLTEYLTLKEINALFQNVSQQPNFTLNTIGHSRQNQSIDMLSFERSATQSILLFGGEDASEPVFSQTISHLLAELQNPAAPIHDYPLNWHFISCMNPDGYQRNEGWLKAPGDLTTFFDHSWEDVHSDMLFWSTGERSESVALKQAISEIAPDFIYNLHDESHFPADGYKFAFSSPVAPSVLDAHLQRVAGFMDISKNELVIVEDYGKDAVYSVSSAFDKNPAVFAFLNESCGYQAVGEPVHEPVLDEDSNMFKHLTAYAECLKNCDHPELESARFHVEHLRSEMKQQRPFNSKALALTGYGLRILKEQTGEDTDDLRHFFLEAVLKRFENHYRPISVTQQVFAQTDFLFTLLKHCFSS